MEAQDKQEDEIPISEVITALLDLGRLSHHVESAASEAPEAIATILLERLLLLCRAQRGAILFTTQGPAEAYRAFMFPPPSRKGLRTFALHRMNEEEAYALVADRAAEDAAVQSPPGKPCWVICRLPISVGQSGGQVPFAQQEDIRKKLSAVESSSHTFLPLYALLLLGWEGNEEHVCIEATKKGQAVLPLVTDSAGSALMNILLAERVHELETLADHKALREMELLKAELLATVSHELRSPLASIKGYAATLLRHERRISREERHEFLLAIAQASDRLEAVIERLLEISQLETGAITIERSSVDLAYLVREAITAIERRLDVPEPEAMAQASSPMDGGKLTSLHPTPAPTAEGQGHTTFTLRLLDRYGMPTHDELIIQADRNRLREVLDNLLENAVKYSPQGGTIEVVIRPLVASSQASRSRTVSGKSDHDRKMGIHPSVPRSRQMVEICVRDNGIGIPASHLERIFDRFHRVDTRLTREVNGIGLGLAICKRIVELHGGMIWAESEIGTGSVFHVWLPMDERT